MLNFCSQGYLILSNLLQLWGCHQRKPVKAKDMNICFKATDERVSTDCKAKWCERGTVLWTRNGSTASWLPWEEQGSFMDTSQAWHPAELYVFLNSALASFSNYPPDLEIASDLLRTSLEQKKWKTTCSLVRNTAGLKRKQETSNSIRGHWLELETRLGDTAEQDSIS